MRSVSQVSPILYFCFCVVLAPRFCTVSCLSPNDTEWVPKCCPIGEIKTTRGCVSGGEGLNVPKGILVLHSEPKCSEVYYLEPERDKYNLFYNGTLLLNENGVMVTIEDFCLDENSLNKTFIYVCFPKLVDTSEKETQLKVYSVGLFISLPFIFATFLVYAVIKKLAKLHGKCVKYHSLCLFLSYFLLGIVQNNVIQEDVLCYVLGYAIQFFFMATFFWLNVMCFDIYWAFSGLRNLTGSAKERERKKLIVYSIYAWCSPLLILVITVAVDFSPSVPINSFFKPRVGEERCFFKEKGATWIYFYLPMALIILSNIILFGVTAFRIWSHRRETAVLKRGDSRKHDSTNDKERFTLYLKLFIVMGINWVMELLSSLAGGPAYLWYISDFTNTLQGLFIFLIFVWKKRVRRLVWSKIRSCCAKETISSGPRTWSGASSRNTNSTNSTHTINTSIKMNPATHDPQTTLA